MRWSGRKGSRCAAVAGRGGARVPFGFAVAGFAKVWDRERRNRAPGRPEQTREHRTIADDAELQLFRGSVNCAAVLEGMVGGWKLDVRENTRRALKYRCGKGEVLIVSHDGRGWWDPLSQANGDIFDLVQYLDRSLNCGQVRSLNAPATAYILPILRF